VAIERAGPSSARWKLPRTRRDPATWCSWPRACASFDQFQNYEHRGRVFKDLVHQLERQAASTTSGRG